jgi:hypothetical protein
VDVRFGTLLAQVPFSLTDPFAGNGTFVVGHGHQIDEHDEQQLCLVSQPQSNLFWPTAKGPCWPVCAIRLRRFAACASRQYELALRAHC